MAKQSTYDPKTCNDVILIHFKGMTMYVSQFRFKYIVPVLKCEAQSVTVTCPDWSLPQEREWRALKFKYLLSTL